jgi:hypothetical protein
VEIDEIPSHENGVHIFKPPVQPTTTDKTCTTDIAYKPMTDGTMKLCFKTGFVFWFYSLQTESIM